MRRVKRWLYLFLIACVDWTAIIYFYIIVSSLLSLVVFVPFLPGIFIYSLVYYVFCLWKWGKTLGMFIFSAIYQSPHKICVIAKEVLTSMATFFLIFYVYTIVGIRVYLLCWIITIFLLFMFPCLKFRIFRSRLMFSEISNWAVKKKVLKYYFLLWSVALFVRIVFYLGLDNFQTSYISPHTTHKYVDFLQKHRQNTLDYIFSLYEKYDHVILCERLHSEYTQWDLIYSLISDPRYAQKKIHMFTEYGRVDAQEQFERFLSKDYPNDTILEKKLAYFCLQNTAIWPLWDNTNWFDFLKKFYFQYKEKGLKLWFTDEHIPWDQIRTPEEYQNSMNYHRDSIMAANIINRIHKDSISKSLIIMNTRHALTKGPQNCGYYIAQQYKGKVANLLLNTLQYIPPFFCVQNGVWDCAFSQIPDSTFAFNFKNSPFGYCRLDLWSGLIVARGTYEDFFTGFIFYQPLKKHFKAFGHPYALDYGVVEVKRRSALISEDYYARLKWKYKNSVPFYERLFYYTWDELKDLFFILSSVFSLFFIGIMWGIWKKQNK